jgi:hypothetical protein
METMLLPITCEAVLGVLAYNLRVKGSKTTSFASMDTERKTENGKAEDVPPPGVPLVTVIWADPTAEMKLGATVADR